MDDFKRATVKDYTAWDLNTKYVKDRKLKQKFNKKGRKKIKKDLTIYMKYDIIRVQ